MLLTSEPTAPSALKAKISVRGLSFHYGAHRALSGIDIDIPENCVTAFIGPSGCGKSTLLRCLNRMNDFIDGTQIEGHLALDGCDIYAPNMDPVALRREIGMVFQEPNPFPMSVFDNVAYGPRIHGIRERAELETIVRRSLERAALWDEVRDKLTQSGLKLSGGQQQRLCIARALAVEPTILLMDEPCSALDPIATAKIEDLLLDLKREYTIVIVTHNMQQAQRASDYTAFFMAGELVEFNSTTNIFLHPTQRRTEDYISGRFG